MDACEIYETVVLASFSQFYLRSAGAAAEAAEFGSGPIAFVIDPGEIMLTSPIQDAALAVTIRMFVERPDLLDGSWNDVIELSFRAGASTSVTGWESTDHDLVLPLVPGKTYRLRYAIANIDQPVERHVEIGEVEAPFADMVRIDLWPADLTNAELLVQRTRGGRYWVVSNGLRSLRTEIGLTRSDASETERVAEFADRAFALFPELVRSTIEDEGDGLARDALVLLDIPDPNWVKAHSLMSWAEQSKVRDARRRTVTELLVSRARLSTAAPDSK